MQLDANQRRTIEEWMKAKVRFCSLCGNHDFSLHDGIYALPRLEGEKVGTTALEQIVVYCRNCGVEMSFSTKILGLR
jgi:hypothetical protein